MTALQLFAYIAAATALQLLLGVAFAVWRAKRMVGAEAPGVPALLKDAAWTGLRDFRVTGRAFEDLAQTQSSFTLAPIDGQPLAPCKPGQFLTFSLPVAGEDAPGRVVRCYSISDTPAPDQYRITVKRALAPAGSPEVPAGLASAWLHDQAQIGTIVQVRAPAGQFVFTPEPDAPPVFIAGGIGITPILPMLKAELAQEPGRVAHLFYGVHNGQDHAFRAVLSRLAAAHPGLALHLHYSNPAMEDVQGRDYEHAGFLSLDYLKQTLPYGRHAFYLCGPDPMMQALIPALLDWGVDIADIHRESFGPQTAAPKPAGPATAGPVLAISFRRSGRTLDWTGQDTNLLDFAERNSIRVDSGCRSGSCGTCEIALISGRVTYGNKPDHDITPGHCLLCLGIPVTALELDA